MVCFRNALTGEAVINLVFEKKKQTMAVVRYMHGRAYSTCLSVRHSTTGSFSVVYHLLHCLEIHIIMY